MFNHRSQGETAIEFFAFLERGGICREISFLPHVKLYIPETERSVGISDAIPLLKKGKFLCRMLDERSNAGMLLVQDPNNKRYVEMYSFGGIAGHQGSISCPYESLATRMFTKAGSGGWQECYIFGT